jgi:UPF0271 protein
MTRIDLNCDMGESFGLWSMGHDAEVMGSISSANIACGFHGGDPEVMRRTVRLARQHGVAVGAHPGLPDLVGFGRREMKVSPDELEDMMLYQIGALAAMAAAEGVSLQHVKAHGALYNMAAADEALARAIAEATAQFTGVALFVLPGSAMASAAAACGVPVVPEAFLDRGYERDGTLTPRSKPDALITDPAAAAARALQIAQEGVVIATDGTRLAIRARTICTHSDTPGGPALVAAARNALEQAGIQVAPPHIDRGVPRTVR